MSAPQCLSCTRFYAAQSAREAEGFEPTGTCEAYPERIPQQIWRNEHGHDRPYPLDGGLRFVQDPAATSADVAALPDAMAAEAAGGSGLAYTIDDRPCASCLHAFRVERGAKAGQLDGTCLAFPEGIPQAILLREHDHRYPFPGDDGVRFAQDPERVDGYTTPMLSPAQLRG